ncbi:MAG: hypothetical protein JW838_05075 [Spirochaetes bacterium]|nr:hypothetical protein [Spirochaetota bacterium]
MLELSHRVCTIRMTQGRITAVHNRRKGAIIGSLLLGFFGASGSTLLSIIVCSRVMEGTFTPDLLLAPLTGLPFIALAVLYIAILGRRWGTVELDRERNTLLWLQGGAARGTWMLSDVARVERRYAFLHTYRVSTLGRVERWMSLLMKDGTRVPLFLGTGEELEKIGEHLGRWGLPVQ